MKTKIKINTKNTKKWITAISFVFVWASCGQIAIAADITAQKMIELTNESREKSGLLPLMVNDKLIAAAEAKADDMFKFQYFDHNSPSGITPWHWIKSAGYDYHYAGENLAIDFITAEGTHMALMRSVSHRDNILKPNYTEIGIAVKKGIFNGNESIIIVEEFGAPLKIENQESGIKNNADVFLQENKYEEENKEENKYDEHNERAEEENKLVEIKSPVVYFKNEEYKNSESGREIEKMEIKENDMELVLPTLFPVENVKPLDKIYTENIFWTNCEEKGVVDNLKAKLSDYLYFLNI